MEKNLQNSSISAPSGQWLNSAEASQFLQNSARAASCHP